MKKHILRTLFGAVVLLVFLAHAYEYRRIPLIDRLEALAYDIRLSRTMPGTVSDRLVILDIDETSLQEKDLGGEGRWPWPRDRLALLMDKLFDKYQVAVVGFDIVFSERDESSGVRVLERLAERELKGVTAYESALLQLKRQLDYDGLFAGKLANRNVVLGYLFSDDVPARPKGMLPAPVLRLEEVPARRTPVRISRDAYTANLPELQQAAASAGHFNVMDDPDGITRRVPMLLEHKGGLYEALSLAVVRLLLGSPPLRPVYVNDRLEELRVGPLAIPVDGEWSALVPYRGKSNSFKYYSLVDVLNERIDIGELKGRIALVGTSAPGLDLHATPVEGGYPGVEVHANLIAGMLDENIKHRPADVGGWELLLLLAVGVILVFFQPRLKFLAGTIVTLMLLAIVVTANVALFHYENVVLPLASAVTMILILFTFNLFYGFFVEARGKRAITGLFGQYVPPQLVDEMAQDPERFSMEGESRDMTVLFTDVRGFTSISEQLDPKALSNLMNEFLTPLTEVIYQYGGTIDKYMGDCIMAFWGAPVREDGHALKAIRAALEMQQALKRLQPAFKAKYGSEVRIGIGLNTGRMSVGNMGSRIRVAYTVMGDAVNLASRLEGLTKEYGADIIVGEGTKQAVGNVVFRELDRVRVKGKEVAVTIYEPLGLAGQVEPATLTQVEIYREALQHYRSQNWEQAVTRLNRLQAMAPDVRLYTLFLERIAILRADPPGSDWDGAFTFETK